MNLKFPIAMIGSLLFAFGLTFFTSCGGDEKPRCTCVVKSPTVSQTCFDICTQGTQCTFTNDVGGRFCACASSQEDCTGKCKECVD